MLLSYTLHLSLPKLFGQHLSETPTHPKEEGFELRCHPFELGTAELSYPTPHTHKPGGGISLLGDGFTWPHLPPPHPIIS